MRPVLAAESAHPRDSTRRVGVTGCEIHVMAGGAHPACAAPRPSEHHVLSLTDRSGRMCVYLALRSADDVDAVRAAVPAGHLQILVGDYTEPGVSAAASVCAYATWVDIDLRLGNARFTVSETGLPPVFYSVDGATVSVSSPFRPQRGASGRLDLDGVADTMRWGYTLDGRTLSSKVRVAPADATATVSIRDALRVTSPNDGGVDEALLRLSSDEIREEQVAAILAAARRLPLDGAFLSLSGGLDSRTALVSLLSQHRRVPCVTMAGSTAMLDARLAHAVTQAHGLDHQIVELGQDYLRQLPDLALRCAALTGGQQALDQTIDMYLYQQMPGTAHTRISGCLGNQVGRGMVEGLPAERPSLDLLSIDLRSRLDERPRRPWFLSRMASKQLGHVLLQENHFFSIANHVVGSAFALQLSPYADHRLIELCKASFVKNSAFGDVSWNGLRQRAFRHRLRGEPIERSFQRALLKRYDRAGRRVPINWGWLASGGWSLEWVPTLMASVAEETILKMGRRFRGFEASARWLSAQLGEPSTLVDWPKVFRVHLRELAHDTLLSSDIAHSGMVEPIGLRKALDEHFAGRADHHATLRRLLDIGLGIHAGRAATENAPVIARVSP